MKRIVTSLLLTGAVVAGVQGVAAAGPPPNEDPRCTYSHPKQLRLAAVARRGIPIEARCDGPAKVSALVLLRHNTPQDERWEELNPNHIPGIQTARSGNGRLRAAGSVTVRVRLRRRTLRMLRSYRRTRLDVMLCVRREDGIEWSTGRESTLTVVR